MKKKNKIVKAKVIRNSGYDQDNSVLKSAQRIFGFADELLGFKKIIHADRPGNRKEVIEVIYRHGGELKRSFIGAPGSHSK